MRQVCNLCHAAPLHAPCSELVAGLTDKAKLEEQVGFIEGLDPPAPAPGPVYAPPAAAPAAEAHPAPSEGAAAAALAPADVPPTAPALQAAALLPDAAAGLLQPAGIAAPAAAPLQAATAAGPVFGSGLLPQEQQHCPAWQPERQQGPGQPPMQQQECEDFGQQPPVQPQDWEGPGQQPPMQQQEWQQQHVQQQWQPMCPAGAPPAGAQLLPRPSPFQAAAAAAPGDAVGWGAGSQHAQQPPQGTLPAGLSLQVSAPALAASGAELSWAAGGLAPQDFATGGPGSQPGSPRFYELDVTALPPGTTDGQLASFFRCSRAPLHTGGTLLEARA